MSVYLCVAVSEIEARRLNVLLSARSGDSNCQVAS